MKKKLIMGIFLIYSFVSLATAPPPISFNTAIAPGYTSVKPVGQLDSKWRVAQTNLNANTTPPAFLPTVYLPAQIVSPVGSWYNPPATALCGWITFPNICSSTSAASHSCVNSGGGVDQWYRAEFELNCAQYCLDLKIWADNSVKEIYVNTMTSGSPGYWLNPSTNVSPNYEQHHGYEYPNKIQKRLCDNWVTGTNYIIIHVVSNGGSTTSNDYAGLLVKVNTSLSTQEDCTMPPPPSCCLGNLCEDTQIPLAGDYEIPLNNYNFNFSGLSSDKVNVGYNCGGFGIGKFNTFTGVQTNPTGSGPESISIFGQNQYLGVGTAIGVMGVSKNKQQPSTSIGVSGQATGFGDNIGGNFFATDGNLYNIGVSAVATAANASPPVPSYILQYSQGANIGIYAAGDIANTGPSGIGPNWAGWFDGDIMVVGTPYSTAGGMFTASDLRFKKDINQLTSVIERLRKIKGYTYKFKTDEFKERNFSKDEQIGLIAQELKEVFPQLVAEKEGYSFVNYSGLIPVLLEGFKEQQTQLDQQQQQLIELKALVQSLAGSTGAVGGKTSGLPVNLSDKNTIVLNQNVPNPFAESTVITYAIPQDFTKAQILFSTNDGIVIKVVDITQKGSGTLNVFADDLSHGMYTYQLVVDGKIIDTKKMIKQ